MKTEYELRVLEIDKNKLIKDLEEMGAIKRGEYNQKRYVYDLNPPEPDKWIRLRTNGKDTTITYKNVQTKNIDGTKEVEIIVSDFEVANELLENIGFKSKAYQENTRIQYELNGIEIDIDTWPLIPTYVEIEGNSEESVIEMLNLLKLDKKKMTTVDVQGIYKNYGINLDKIKILKF